MDTNLNSGRNTAGILFLSVLLLLPVFAAGGQRTASKKAGLPKLDASGSNFTPFKQSAKSVSRTTGDDTSDQGLTGGQYTGGAGVSAGVAGAQGAGAVQSKGAASGAGGGAGAGGQARPASLTGEQSCQWISEISPTPLQRPTTPCSPANVGAVGLSAQGSFTCFCNGGGASSQGKVNSGGAALNGFGCSKCDQAHAVAGTETWVDWRGTLESNNAIGLGGCYALRCDLVWNDRSDPGQKERVAIMKIFQSREGRVNFLREKGLLDVVDANWQLMLARVAPTKDKGYKTADGGLVVAPEAVAVMNEVLGKYMAIVAGIRMEEHKKAGLDINQVATPQMGQGAAWKLYGNDVLSGRLNFEILSSIPGVKARRVRSK